MTLGARCAAGAPERFPISPGRTCGFATKFLEPALTWTFADPLIDCEEDRTLRAVVVGLVAEMAPEVAALTPRVGPNGYLRRRPLPLGDDDESVVFLND
jgi:hypothetical protein